MPLTSSQDVDARFAVFLNPIRDLTKNWEVDIAKYLEEYLVELAEIQITFDGGETTMNFAEAAMLIQGTATVYSKKVEFLWQMVLQMLDLLSSKKSLEKGNEPNLDKTSESNRNISKELSNDFSQMDNLQEGKNINMKEEESEEQTQRNCFRFLPAMPLHLVEKEGEKSHMKIGLFLKNLESFGYKDDFRINRSFLTPSGLLCLELPQEILLQRVCLASQQQCNMNDSIAGFLENNHLQEYEAPNDVEDDNFFADDQDHNEADGVPVESFVASAVPQEPVSEVDPVKEELNTCTDKEPKNDVVSRYGLRKKVLKSIVPAKLNIPDLLKPQDPHRETPANRPPRSGRLKKPMACLCHKDLISRKRSRKSNQKNEQKNTISVESFIVRDLVNLVAQDNNNTKKGSVVSPYLLENLAKEEALKTECLQRKRTNQIIADDDTITEIQALQKIEEEAKQEKKEASLDDDAVPDLDFDDFHAIDDGPMNISLPIAHDDGAYKEISEESTNNLKNLNDNMMYEAGSDYEALVQKWVSEYVTNAQEHITSTDLAKRVNKWRQTITPKLIEEEDRKNFDIHEYGSYVLSKFPDGDSSPVSFEKVVEGKEPKEVSRMFLSSLMLANTYNIELTQSCEGDLQMDCLQMSLLTRIRHHQELEEHGPTSPKKKPTRIEKRKDRSSSGDDITRTSSPVISRISKKTKKKQLER